MKLRTPGEKAEGRAARSLAALDGIVSGLTEANRLLDAEHTQALEAEAHHTSEAQRHRERADAAIDAVAKHGRIVARISALTD